MTDERAVLNVLLGIERPITLAELSRATGLDRRSVEQAVNALRHGGEPVGTGSAGVWYERDPERLAAIAAGLRRRAVQVLLTSRALRRTVTRMRREEQRMEQPSIWS